MKETEAGKRATAAEPYENNIRIMKKNRCRAA
jgi:hypothetical protein